MHHNAALPATLTARILSVAPSHLPSLDPHAPPIRNGASRSRLAVRGPEKERTGVKAPMRMAMTFTFFLFLSSPSGQRWQYSQS